MKKFNKILAGILAVSMSLSLAACSDSQETGDGEAASISWWVANNSTAIVKSYDEIAAVDELQKRLGVDIQFIHPTASTQTEQFNIMAASGDFSDIVTYNWNGYTGGPVKAAADGAILALDDYLEKHMPNLLSIMDEDPSIDYLARAYDGSVYLFPNFTDDKITTATFGPVIRKDWLDKLGLAVPETIEDWYTVLKAFKTQDPNGNGQADEIPFAADGTATFLRFSRAYGGVTEHFNLDGEGKIRYGFIEPEYKEFLTEINKWYKEGLIDQEYAASNSSMINTNMVSEISGAFVGYAGSAMIKYMTAGRESNPDFTLIGTQWPTHNGGAAYCGYPYQVEAGTLGLGAAVAATNENVEKTLEVLDYLYGEEGKTLMNWGILGETYEETRDGNQFTDLILKNPENKTPVEAITSYSLVQTPLAVMDSKAYMQVNSTHPEQVEAMQTWSKADISRIMPSLSVSPEEQSEITKVLDDVLTYRMEWLNKFVMGVEPIEKWDEVAEEIRRMGIDDAIAVYQAAYDRSVNR